MKREPSRDLRGPAAEALRKRQRALDRFSAWEAEHPRIQTPQAALSGVGLLYDLLPPGAVRRPLDTRGVRALQRALSVLTAGE